MKQIYEDDWLYSLLLPYVNLFIRCSFRKIRYKGRENIPDGGAVIFSPNHCDALMDPLAVLAIDSHKKVFVARADLFRKPALAKILRFLKIMPIHRVRDGFRNVLNTGDTVEKSIEVLNNDVPFCILPEGMHRPMHSLLPLGKGLSRIAVGADRKLDGRKRLYVVPVGCEYGDYFRFRSTLLVTIGKALDITEHIASNRGKSEAELQNSIRALTAEAMKKDIVYIPDDDNYEAVWELCKIHSGCVPERKLGQRLRANQQAAAKLSELLVQAPDKAGKLFEKAVDFSAERRRAKVSLHVTNAKNPLLSALWYSLRALFFLPFALVYAIASLPAWAVSEKIAAGARDKTFRNSFRCVGLLLLWTLTMIAWTAVLFCTLKWYMAVAALLLLVPAPWMAYDYLELARRCASSWRYLFNGRLRKQKEVLSDEMKNLYR